MNEIEFQERELELDRVRVMKKEMLLNIAKRKDEIKRIEANILLQEKREAELKVILEGMIKNG